MLVGKILTLIWLPLAEGIVKFGHFILLNQVQI